MNVEFSADTTEIDEEFGALHALKANVQKGHLEVGRDDQHRLVFRMTAAGTAAVEQMGKS